MRGCICALVLVVCLLLSGCGDSMPQEDIVGNGQAFEMQQVGEDLQASNFPAPEEKRNRQVTLADLRDEVTGELREEYFPEAPMSQQELERLTGISKDMYVEYLAERRISDDEIDMLLIIHAKEDSVGAIEAALETYRTKILSDNEEDLRRLGKAEASRMETIEDYICFVLLGGDTAGVAPQEKEAVTEYCLERNERAIHVLEQAILQ